MKIIAMQVLSITEQQKRESSTSPLELQYLESIAYYYLGRIYLNEGTKVSARIALEHFERYRDIWEAVGDTEMVTLAESFMAEARGEYEGWNEENIKDELEKRLTRYNQCVKKYGQNGTKTLVAGRSYAISLVNAKKLNEAESLMGKLLPICHRVLGQTTEVQKM